MSEEIPEPGSAEWNEEILREAKRIRFYEESKNLAKQMQRGNHSSSWERIDLNDAIDRSEDSLEPRWMIRADGAALLYPGCTHSFHGATGSGKTWAALLACAQVLNDTQEHVLYVDYESFAVQIIRRLKMLGVSPLVLKSRLHYVRPDHRPDAADVDKNAFSEMLSENYAIAVIDGANISMGLAGLNPNNAEEVAEWHNLILNPIAETTGAAVIANDHVPKRDELMGFAIGSQHKIAGLTGAAYRVEKLKPFGRGKYGIAAIAVGDKDREGYIHEIGVEHEQLDGLFVTELHIDATDIYANGGVVGSLHVPDGANIQRLADKRGKKPTNGGDSSRPTKEMEVVSAYWEEKKNDDPMERTQRKTIDVIRDRQLNAQQPQMAEKRLKTAINILIDPKTNGGPFATRFDGPRNSHIYVNVQQYLEANDPDVTSNNVIKFQASGKSQNVGA